MRYGYGNFARLKVAATNSNANAVRGNVDARTSWAAALRTGAAGSQDESRRSAIHMQRPYRGCAFEWRLI
jgi:hypothetical protein